MRYDKLFTELDRLRDKYEAEIRRVLAKAAANDVDTGVQLLAHVKKVHWTQTPAGKKRLAAKMRKQWKEKKI